VTLVPGGDTNSRYNKTKPTHKNQKPQQSGERKERDIYAGQQPSQTVQSLRIRGHPVAQRPAFPVAEEGGSRASTLGRRRALDTKQ